MPRYKLRTLLILLAVGPMVLAAGWFFYADYRERQQWEGVGGPGLIDTSSWGAGCRLDETEQPEDEAPTELP